MFVGDPFFCNGSFHFSQVSREDIGLSHYEWGRRGVEGGEHCGITLLCSLIQLKYCHLYTAMLLVPIVVLQKSVKTLKSIHL